MQKINFIGKTLLIKTEKKKFLVIGDLHLGYEESLNSAGIFMHHHLFDETINYLEKVFRKTGEVNYVILLGDVKHVFHTIMRQEKEEMFNLFNYLEKKCSKIIITKGNHDSILEPVVKKYSNISLVNYHLQEELLFAHGDRQFPEMKDKKVKYLILAHGHPAVKISDKVKTEKYKCFLVGKYKGKNIIILPSFIEANEGSDPRENNLEMCYNFDLNNFKVQVIREESLEVLNFGKLKKLS